MAGMTDSKLSMIINAQMETAQAVKSLQTMTSQIQAESNKINKSLEKAFAPLNKKGMGGGIFANMAGSIKGMQDAIGSLSSTMTSGTTKMVNAIKNVGVSVNSVKDSIMSLSTALKTITEREYKIRIKEERTGGTTGSTQPAGGKSSGGSGKSSDLPSNLLSAKSDIVSRIANIVQPTRQDIEKAVLNTPLRGGGTIASAFNKEVVNKFIDMLTRETAAKAPMGIKDMQAHIKRWVETNRKGLTAAGGFDAIKKQIESMVSSGAYTFGKADVSADAIDKMARRIATAQMMSVPDTGVNKFKETAASKDLTNILRTRVKDIATKGVSVQQAVAADNILMALRGAQGSKGQFKISLSELEKMGLDISGLEKTTAAKQLAAQGKSPQQIKDEILIRFNRAISRQLDTVARKIIADFEKQGVVATPKSTPTMAGTHTVLPSRYLDWQKGQFKSGAAFFADAKEYINFAVKQKGMTPQEVMKVLNPLIDQNVPAEPRTIGTFFSDTSRVAMAKNLANLAAAASGAKRPVDSLGNSMGLLSQAVHKQGEAVLRLGRYYMSFFAITSTIRSLTAVFKEAITFHDQFKELQKFLPKGSNIGGLREGAYGLAISTGNPIDTVLGSYTEFAKQGKKANEIFDYTKAALMGVNVASTDFKTTVTYLTTATNVWKESSSDLISLIDKLALVQAKSSASSEVLIAAMQRSASMAKSMGISQDQLFGYIAAVSEKTQLSGEVIGTSLRTIFSRSRRQKTLDMLEGTSQLKGQQFWGKMSGELAGAPQILDAVANSWNKLTDVQQRNIATQMAGERQINAFMALMENMQRANEITASSIMSYGFATRANETELEKFSKAMQRLQTITMEITTSVFLPWIGLISKVSNGFANLIASTGGFAKLMTGLSVGWLSYSGAASLAAATYKPLISFMTKTISLGAGMAVTMARSAAATIGLSNATVSASTGLNALTFNLAKVKLGWDRLFVASTATRGMGMILSGLGSLLNPILIGIAAITTGIMAYNALTQESTEKQQEYNNRLKETIELASKLKELSTISEREIVAGEQAKILKPEDYKKYNISMEYSTASKAYVPSYTSEKDFKAWMSRVRADYIVGQKDITIEDIDAASKAFGKQFEILLDKFGRTPEGMSETVKAFKDIKQYTNKQPFEFSPQNYKERGVLISYNRDLKRGIQPPIEEYLFLLKAQRRFQEELSMGAGDASEASKGQKRVDVLRTSGLLEDKSFLTNITNIKDSILNSILNADDIKKAIEHIKSRVPEEKTAQNAKMVEEAIKERQIQEERAFESWKNIIDIQVNRKQNRLVTQTAISEPSIAEYLETLKEIQKVELRTQEIKRKAASEGKPLDDIDVEKDLQGAERDLRALQRVQKNILVGTTPTKLLEEHANRVKAWMGFAPQGQEEIYENLAIEEMKKIEQAIQTVMSSGTIDLTADNAQIRQMLEYRAQAEVFIEQIRQGRKTREQVLKEILLDRKLDNKLTFESTKYAGDILQELARAKRDDGSVSIEWISKFNEQTDKLKTELEAARAAKKSAEFRSSDTQDIPLDPKEIAKWEFKVADLEKKLQLRADMMRTQVAATNQRPFLGIERLNLSPDVMEYERKMFEQYHKQTLKGGVSKDYYSGLTSKIATLQTDIVANMDRLSQGETTGELNKKQIDALNEEIALKEELIKVTEKYRSLASQDIAAMSAEEYLKRNKAYIEQTVLLEKERLDLNERMAGLTDRLQASIIANEQILKIENQIKEAVQSKNEAIRDGEAQKATSIQNTIDKLQIDLRLWKDYRDNIFGIIPAVKQFGAAMEGSLKNIQQETQTGISFVDNLINRLYSIAGKIFTIGINFVTTGAMGDGLNKLSAGINAGQETFGKIKELKNYFSGLSGEDKDILGGVLRGQAETALDTYANILGIDKSNIKDPRTQAYLRLKTQVSKDFSYDRGGARAAERDKESTAHYDALERIKKAEFAFQQQQKLASYWENKMPDKYLLKYDAETAKYQAELDAKEKALAAEGKNLKDDEVKRFKEEINVLKEKIRLQEEYRNKAIEISQLEQFQSDNKIGLEKLKTQLSIMSEIYDMEFNALNSPTRAEEKDHMEWKIKAQILELQNERAIQIEENRRAYVLKGLSEEEAMALALDNEQVKLLDIRIAKEEALLGLVDRQLALKEKQKILEQVKEIQGMIGNSIFDVISLKGKDDKKKQIAELTKELYDLVGQSEQSAYGLAEAEGQGNIDRINAARDKWGDVNKQMEETRKKMDEVNASTNKWKELLQNIGDSILKKISDKLADMLMNQTGLGDIFGSIFGGIEKIGGTGGKSRVQPPATSSLGIASLLAAPGGSSISKAMSAAMGGAGLSPTLSGPTSIVVNQSGSAGGGLDLSSLLGGKMSGGAGSTAMVRNAYTGRMEAASAAKTKTFGPINYLTAAMLGYGIGSSTNNRAMGFLGGAAAGFLTGGPVGAIIGGIASLFGKKRGDDTPPPVAPAREFYALAKNSESLDRNTAALMKISEGVFNQPSVFEFNKLQAESNAPRQTFNLTVNVSGSMNRAMATEVGNTILQTVSQGMSQSAPRTATVSTANWG